MTEHKTDMNITITEHDGAQNRYGHYYIQKTEHDGTQNRHKYYQN